MMRHEAKRWIGDRFSLLTLLICAMALSACATVPKGEMTQLDLPYLQVEGVEPLGTPGKKIKGTVGAGPGTMELTDAAGDKAFVHVDEKGKIDDFVDNDKFDPVRATLELNDRSKTTWTKQDGKWKEETRTSSGPGASAQSAGTAAAPIPAGGNLNRSSFFRRLMDTEFIFQVGHSFTSGVNSTSRGAPPGGAPFLQGSGESEASGFSYNFTLRHPFDRFMVPLGGGRPFLYMQGAGYHGFDGTGGAGMSATGFDRTALNRHISHTFGLGVGYSHPLYCPHGGQGDDCVELGLFAGAKAVRQRLSATADEAGNVRTFQDNFYQVVPSGGAMLTAPGIWKGSKFVATYEAFGLNSAALSGGPSFFGNVYDYRTDGGLVHNFWLGMSVNLGGIFSDRF
jgi:hypothetical protein